MASLFYDKSRRVIRQLTDLPLSGSVDTGSINMLKNGGVEFPAGNFHPLIKVFSDSARGIQSLYTLRHDISGSTPQKKAPPKISMLFRPHIDIGDQNHFSTY
ncbi:hypothetical protein A3K33_01015 [Candidatus Azambacteria bacterium RIFOXYC1_FULL_41_20]|nr:MAG: hypothetical protein A2193_01035 [Candidatus Azambacteria bacterium RIFOXYA1_FULL_42_37]OGD43606.1 MAG: hypothetical protein A3K33_01015 [Candidatus Azambacteria bacterium RIFOXYC1_FULL_41_20]OGD47399.1 MAG: hypothetical protein A3K35_01015 [Candidatus Azambacteria bacterium RIFOXYD1_FULL_42_38]HBW55862.1 hypothetical protein [Candidatus Azambacteria bacterium]